MFGIGTAEILVILCIALVVLGPKELPKVARTVGRGIREIQRARDDLKKFEENGPETAACGGRGNGSAKPVKPACFDPLS